MIIARIFHTTLAALISLAGIALAAAPGDAPRLVSKEVFLRHENRRPHVTGFVSYVHPTRPILMHCSGREDYSDGYDDFAVRTSTDNGRTWTTPEMRWKSAAVPAGRLRYAEPAAHFDARRGKLVVLIDKVLYPKDQLDVGAEYALELNIYDSAAGKWTVRRGLSFPGQRVPAMSFSFPVAVGDDQLVFPGMRQTRDAAGKAKSGCWPTTIATAWRCPASDADACDKKEEVSAKCKM